MACVAVVVEVPVYATSSPRRCWRPHVKHTCIRPNLTYYGRARRLHKGARQQDSKSNRNPNLRSVSGQAVTVIAHRSQYDNSFSSLSSEGVTVLRSTRWEGPCIMDTGPILAGWIRAVSWSTEVPDHISLRPLCSSDHPRSTSSYLVAFGANPSGSRGASGLPPLRPRSIDRGTRLC